MLESAIIFSAIFGLVFYLGILVLMIFACRKIAQSKNLSPNYMWFGLLGVIGIIVVAVMPANQNYNPYYDPRNNSYNPYMNQNPYGQNQNQYGQNQYNRNTYGQNGGNQGYTLNGQYYQNDADGKRCSKCGASVSSDTDYCPFCGNKVN